MLARLAVILLTGLALACGPGSGGPTPTPGGLDEALPALILRGATIHQTVSGDAGCPGAGLHSNAIRLELSLPQDPARYTVHLFRWRRSTDFDAAAPAFAECVNEFLRGSEGELPVDEVEARPWRAYGPAWSEDLRLLVEEALRDIGSDQ